MTTTAFDCSISFDSNDEVSFYYGNLGKDDVKDILNEAPIGTFLIRDSTKDYDQKVLCVKEAPKCINNYKIVHKLMDTGDAGRNHVFYLYGKEDCLFESIPKILEFYSNHYLNQSPLVKPAFHHKKVIALYDFLENGDPVEDLYFKKGEVLTIVEYTQGENWWKAVNSKGSVGLIPVPLVRRLKPNEWPLRISNTNVTTETRLPHNDINTNVITEQEIDLVSTEESPKSCPFNAKVIEDYTPSPYEHSCISLRKGQIVTVLEMKSMGKWFGQVQSDGRKGLFPFNRVEII